MSYWNSRQRHGSETSGMGLCSLDWHIDTVSPSMDGLWRCSEPRSLPLLVLLLSFLKRPYWRVHLTGKAFFVAPENLDPINKSQKGKKLRGEFIFFFANHLSNYHVFLSEIYMRTEIWKRGGYIMIPTYFHNSEEPSALFSCILLQASRESTLFELTIINHLEYWL